jgi:hypothetical protein
MCIKLLNLLVQPAFVKNIKREEKKLIKKKSNIKWKNQFVNNNFSTCVQFICERKKNYKISAVLKKSVINFSSL